MEDQTVASARFEFETRLRKNPDDATVIEVAIKLDKIPEPGTQDRGQVALLQGFLLQVGDFPEADDDWCFSVFDMRSGQAAEAFEILANRTALVQEALKSFSAAAVCRSIFNIERVWVDPEFRGHGIALRLMREALHMLGRPGLLVIMKAHPDGKNVPAESCVKLASYYQKDKALKLSPLSDSLYPGWLVSLWNEPRPASGDKLHLR